MQTHCFRATLLLHFHFWTVPINKASSSLQSWPFLRERKFFLRTSVRTCLEGTPLAIASSVDFGSPAGAATCQLWLDISHKLDVPACTSTRPVNAPASVTFKKTDPWLHMRTIGAGRKSNHLPSQFKDHRAEPRSSRPQWPRYSRGRRALHSLPPPALCLHCPCRKCATTASRRRRPLPFLPPPRLIAVEARRHHSGPTPAAVPSPLRRFPQGRKRSQNRVRRRLCQL